MKPIKVEDGDMKQVRKPNAYEVTDSDEEKALLYALDQDNPILSNEEITRLLDV